MDSLIKSKRKKHSAPVIQIAPFVDVVLVLLIIFMVATPMMISGVDVSLPEGNENIAADQNLDPVAITLSSDNALYIGEQPVTINELISKLNNKTSNNHDYTVFVRADQSVKYGLIMSVINKLNNEGYKKTILVTDSEANGGN